MRPHLAVIELREREPEARFMIFQGFHLLR